MYSALEIEPPVPLSSSSFRQVRSTCEFELELGPLVYLWHARKRYSIFCTEDYNTYFVVVIVVVCSLCVCLFIVYTFTNKHIHMCQYTHIHIYREREREREIRLCEHNKMVYLDKNTFTWSWRTKFVRSILLCTLHFFEFEFVIISIKNTIHRKKEEG